MPWLYEMGLEVYRAARRGRNNELEKAATEFRQAVEFAVHGPMAREFFVGSREMSEIEPLLNQALSMLGR